MSKDVYLRREKEGNEENRIIVQGCKYKECQKEKMEQMNCPMLCIYLWSDKKRKNGTDYVTKDVNLRSENKGKEGNRIVNQECIFKECQEMKIKEQDN